MTKAQKLSRELSNPLTEDEANSLTEAEKAWLRSWNRHDEIPGEDAPESESDAGSAGDEAGYEEYTIPELQDMLKERELPTSGNKAELIARLEEDDAANA